MEYNDFGPADRLYYVAPPPPIQTPKNSMPTSWLISKKGYVGLFIVGGILIFALATFAFVKLTKDDEKERIRSN